MFADERKCFVSISILWVVNFALFQKVFHNPSMTSSQERWRYCHALHHAGGHLFSRVSLSRIQAIAPLRFDLKGPSESPSFVINPDAVDLSAEEGWSSEDTKRRGAAADRPSRALYRSRGGTAPPASDPGSSIASIDRCPALCRRSDRLFAPCGAGCRGAHGFELDRAHRPGGRPCADDHHEHVDHDHDHDDNDGTGHRRQPGGGGAPSLRRAPAAAPHDNDDHDDNDGPAPSGRAGRGER